MWLWTCFTKKDNDRDSSVHHVSIALWSTENNMGGTHKGGALGCNLLVSDFCAGGLLGREAFPTKVSGAMVPVQWFGTRFLWMLLRCACSPPEMQITACRASNAGASALIGQEDFASHFTSLILCVAEEVSVVSDVRKRHPM